MTEKTKKWSDEVVANLLQIVGTDTPISAVKVEEAATALETTSRSIASKLRSLGHEVASLAKEKVATFTESETANLQSFVESNAGKLTYKGIAENFEGGKFSAKQIQGKLLALELTGSVQPAEKIETVRSYSPAEEATFIKLATSGAFIEDIAAALNKSVASVRGKALSLTRNDQITKIPAQKESHAKNDVDAVTALGDKIATMTVAEIATAVSKTERGLKTLLTRRGLDAADYKGSQKRAKAEAKAAAV